MLYEIRFGTDGLGLAFGNVFADDMNEAREFAAEKLRAENYHLQADEGLFTVHGSEKWTIFKFSAGLYAQRIDDARENRPELTSADVAEIGTEVNERTEQLVRDLKLPGTATGRFPARLPIQHIGRAIRQPVPGLTSEEIVQGITRSLIERPIPECDTAWQNEETCSPEVPCTTCWHEDRYVNPSQEMIDRIGRGAPADDAPEFGRPYRLDEFDADGYARRVIEAMRNSLPDLNEALRDEIPYEGDGFDPLSDR